MNIKYVTNTWEKPIRFDYAFKPYDFPVGQTVEIPEEAARHLFGYGEQNKEPHMIRLGLVNTNLDIPNGYKILSKFLISDEPPRKNHSLSPVVERVPLPSAKKVGGNVNTA
jgi:hypothetical protein